MTQNAKTCALLDIPISSAYRDYGLDMSREAMEGPFCQRYPFGAEVSITVDRRVIRTQNSNRVTYDHSVFIDGPFWGDFDVSFSKEGLLDRVSKVFGRAEIQGGDPLFDDQIYVRADAKDDRLRSFVELDGVQSALLAVILGLENAHVVIRNGRLEASYRTGEGGEVTDYKGVILPALALARWATRV